MLPLLACLAILPLSGAQEVDLTKTGRKRRDVTCNPTRRDVLGPFYEENGLTEFNLAPPYEQHQDDVIFVEGTVTDTNCNPVAGATVEVWYAGGGKSQGCNCLDHLSSNGFGNCEKFSDALGGKICYVDATSTCKDKLISESEEGLYKSAKACNPPVADYTFPPDKLWYRGKITTNQNGEYSYRATFPALYEARPIRHIHYKITDNTRGVELVTQLYFKGYVPPSYEDYVVGRDTQFPTEITKLFVGNNIIFNIVMSA